MKDIIYSIYDFIYDKENNTFYANSEELFPLNENHFAPFPNQRKKFYVLNPKTNNRRRFIFKKQHVQKDKILLEFQSEDEIKCIIS